MADRPHFCPGCGWNVCRCQPRRIYLDPRIYATLQRETPLWECHHRLPRELQKTALRTVIGTRKIQVPKPSA